jgi:hypothetical protein
MSGVHKQRAPQLAPNIPEYSLSAWTAGMMNSYFVAEALITYDNQPFQSNSFQTRFNIVTSSLLPLLHAIHDIILEFLIPTPLLATVALSVQ